MKKLVIIFLLIITTIILYKCVDEIVVPDLAKPNGNVYLESVPEAAEIILDSVKTDKSTPDSLSNLTAGKHFITLKKADYMDTTITSNIVENQTIFHKIILTEVKHTGSIFVESQPTGAQIFLDSINTGKITPDSIIQIKVGEQKLTLKKAGFLDTTLTLLVQNKMTTSKSVELTPIPAPCNIYIESVPNGAQIFLNNLNTSKITPDTLLGLKAGQYNITLKKTNYRDTTVKVVAISYLTVSKKVILSNTKGSISIESQPSGAEIYLNDSYTFKTTPDSVANLNVGIFKVTLKLNSYGDTTFNVDVFQNTETHRSVVLTKIVEKGDLYIESQPQGASIFVDNSNSGKVTPDTIKDLMSGNHNITLKLAGYSDTTFNVMIIRNQQVSKNITLTKEIKTGSILLESSPAGAQIFISGTNTGKLTPSTIQDLGEGSHQFTLKLTGYKDTTFNAAIIRNQQVSKNITLTEEITTGSILLESSPAGAQIFLSGTNTGKLTPSTIQDLGEGSHQFTLKLTGYKDTTFNAAIIRNQQVSKNITLTEEVTTGSILLESSPAGAQIFLSGTNTGKVTPSTIQDLQAGSYQFTLKLNGYKDTTFSADIIKNQQIEKNVTLTKEITTGSILLESSPSGAQIFLSGTNTGKVTPSAIQDLEEGSHEFTLKLNGYNDTTFNATIIKNQQVEKNITLTKEILTGSIFISSEPNGAHIFINNDDTRKNTPNTFSDLLEGYYSFTLKLNFYKDTTLNIHVIKQQLTSKNIILTESSPVKINKLSGSTSLLSTHFIFSFNQDVYLAKVEVFEPNDGGNNTFNFNKNVKSNHSTDIYYLKAVNGKWRLVFYGTKTKDNKTDFVITEEINVP
jgi:PEGA domain